MARLCAFDRGVFVDAEHRSDGKWLPDNPDVSGLEHDNEGERAARIAVGLPERDGKGQCASRRDITGVRGSPCLALK